MIARICALGLSLVAAGISPQEPIRSRVDGVRVDVLVTHRGKPVRGLTANDFELLDNGVPQRFELVASGQPIGGVVLVDVSYSAVAYGHLRFVEAAGEAVIAALRPGDQIGVMTFARGAHLTLEPTVDLTAIRQALSTISDTPIRRTEATALWDAVFSAAAVARTTGGRPTIIVLSDGGDTASWLTARQPAEASRTRTSKARTVDVLRSSGVVVDILRAPAGFHDFRHPRTISTATCCRTRRPKRSAVW